MRRVIPVLLCTVAIVMAAGAWIGNLPREARNNPSIPKLEKPRTEETPTILEKESNAQALAMSSFANLRVTRTRIELKEQELLPAPFGTDAEDSLYYDGPPAYVISPTDVWYCAVRFTPTVNCTVKAVKFYEYEPVLSPGGEVRVYDQNTPNNPGALLSSQSYTAVAPGWRRVDLPAPGVYVPAGRDVWTCVYGVVANPPGESPLTTDDGTNYADDREYWSGDGTTWFEMEDFVAPVNWNERAIIVPVPFDDDMATLSIDGVSSPEQPDQWLTVKATVKNVGLNSQGDGIPVKLEITGPGGYTYNDNDQVTLTSLDYGETEQITFDPPWRTHTAYGIYTIKAWTELTGDDNNGNDTTTTTLEVTDWITYANWNSPYWVTWAGPERGQWYYPNEFGLAYPVTVESLKTEFAWHTSYPWTDSTYRFKIYDGDLQTVLYTSPWLEAAPGVERHYISGGVAISSGTFMVAVECTTTAQLPLTLGDNDDDSRSVFGDPSQWYWWDSGELLIAAYVDWSVKANDVGFYDLQIPYMYVEPEIAVTPAGSIRNYGTANQAAVPCSCMVVDTVTDTRVYSGYASVSVNAGYTAQVTFSPDWTPLAGNNVYQVQMATFLPAEENPTNDAIYHDFFGFDVVDPLVSPSALFAVTFDGVIGTTEWQDANKYDISNILGKNDPMYRYYPGNAFLYLKHDFDYLYLAVDMPFQTTNDTSQIGLYLDEDNDGSWAGDQSEGNYWVKNLPDTVIYRSLPDDTRHLAPGALHASGIGSGNLQFEMAMPFGGAIHELGLDPNGDTCGLWAFALNDEYFEWLGWWLTTMDESHTFEPAYYGKLVLEPATGGWPERWAEVAPMPLDPSKKSVKRGGWLAFNQTNGLVYGAKGYKTTDFYSYDPLANSWTGLTGMPYQTHTNPKWARKVPRKGSKGVCDGDNSIYVTQGNNTLGFWRYNVTSGSWGELPDVPLGPYRKKVKGGTDLAFVPGGEDGDDYVYLLKGYKTEFYRFNVQTEKWDTLAEAPDGTRAKWDKGSWLVFNEADGTDDAKLLYAHKAKYYTGTDHEMWKYNIAGDSWSENKLKGMPLWGLHSGRTKKKKSKDGGSGAWYESEIYALKGGNTQQFFKYTVVKDSWTELDTVPNYTATTGRKRRVKYGADIVSYGTGAFFALKGNKTVEMWRYVIPTVAVGRPERSGVMAGRIEGRKLGVTVAPNPLAGGFVTLRYSLPKAGPARISIFDIAGRTVERRTVLASRTGVVSLDLRDLSAGVYLVRFDADRFTTTHKLVVQH